MHSSAAMISNSQSMISLIIFSFILYVTAKAAPDSENSFIISCGSSTGGTDSNGRNWVPDSKYLITPLHNTKNSTAKQQDPSLPSQTPYISARIFTSESTYQFLVSPEKRHWVRLHFYPSTYDDALDPSNAYFTVVANEFTLLNNFSAYLTAKALTQAYFINEYSLVPFQSGKLNITFKPSSQHRGSYAFVNGIEVIAMPELFQEAPLVSSSTHPMIDVGNYSLQTMFRLNVGGQYVAPKQDSGLSRTWYDDSLYLFGAAFGVTFPSDKNVTIQYHFPEYVAPNDVYATSRSMGPNGTVNLNFNLSWVFRVDANFTYVVRFHFCELELTKINQRVFDIYLNNQTAQEGADVIAWAGSKGVPVYKDFATYVFDEPGNDEELWVALHPSVSTKPQYYDAILNGLEIFKINDSNGNFAGLNPVPSQMLLDAEKAHGGKKFGHSKYGLAAILGGAFGAGFILIVAVCFVVYLMKKRVADGKDLVFGNWLPINASSPPRLTTKSGRKSPSSGNISSLTQGLCQHFSLGEIRNATNNFDESKVIGVGGFGKVYKGIIEGGTEVAIKIANPSSHQGIMEFQTEINLLSKLRHKHLVSLIGFCEEDGEMILVYDYMSNGTLREHLYKSNKPVLSWKQRLEICIGAARGLHYLHTGAKYTIIHRDVKTTNILLDESWVAKVSDFGLSKTGSNLNQTHVSTMVKGSFGYLDPEYFRRQHLTEKSDVYSFGVVLFEVLCARPAIDTGLPKEQVSLADWALMNLKKGTIEDIIDPHLQGKINPECLKKFVETAEKCVADNGLERPSMGDVLWKIEFALQLHENPHGGKHEAEEQANEAYAHNAALDIEFDDSSSSAVFSQIEDPRGR